MLKGVVISMIRSTGEGDRAGGGFGFVKDEGTGIERFFHARDVVDGQYDTLGRGQRVEYEGFLDEAAKARGKGNGMKARQVKAC